MGEFADIWIEQCNPRSAPTSLMNVREAAIGEADRYPSRDEIERVMRDVSPRLQATLAGLDDEQLAGPVTMPGAKTVADQLAFFGLHDTYHVGQMAYVRKPLGSPAIVGLRGNDAGWPSMKATSSTLAGKVLHVEKTRIIGLLAR